MDATDRRIHAQARELAASFRERLAAEIEAGGPRFPVANVADLKAAGFLLLGMPERFGGAGISLPGYCAVIEELATGSPATSLLLTMPAGLAAIYTYPDERVPEAHRTAYQTQRGWVVDESRAGRVFAAGNSERGVGGDYKRSQTRATRTDDGWRLTGQKVFGSWGQHSDWLFSVARLPEGLVPDAGEVEFFFLPTKGEGVHWQNDWNGFGMVETESHSFELHDAPAREIMGFPGFLDAVPSYWWALSFTSVALGCVRALLEPLMKRAATLGPGFRLELSLLTARYESARGYVMDTARRAGPFGDPPYMALVARTKTHVTREAESLAAALFALGGGGAFRDNGLPAKFLRDVFAGTGLRPPVEYALDTLGDGLQHWQEP
jgi:alkylation response protein AidB-like acyl-CoA dehydrogenase